MYKLCVESNLNHKNQRVSFFAGLELSYDIQKTQSVFLLPHQKVSVGVDQNSIRERIIH
jgi:hypothetical protein